MGHIWFSDYVVLFRFQSLCCLPLNQETFRTDIIVKKPNMHKETFLNSEYNVQIQTNFSFPIIKTLKIQ